MQPLVTITSDLPLLIQLFNEAPEIAEEETVATLWEALLLLEREVADRTPVGVGGAAGLKGSIFASRPEVTDTAVVGLVSSSMAHALPVELGTKPHFPPITPLRDWAEKKLGIDPGESKHVAFAIARKIAREGTKGAAMFQKAMQENEEQVLAMMENVVPRIMARMENEY